MSECHSAELQEISAKFGRQDGLKSICRQTEVRFGILLVNMEDENNTMQCTLFEEQGKCVRYPSLYK